MKEILNAIPENIALEMRENFLKVNYDKIFQERNSQFLRQFNEKLNCLPNNDEIYTSYFCRSSYLEKSDLVKTVYENYIKSIIETYAKKSLTVVEFKCYKMIEGGHFRLHLDEFLGEYGFIWYLSKDWKWDWGGLLLTVNPDETANVTLPSFNKLVLMNHANDNSIHCVTHVTPYAKEPRLMLVGFLK